MCLLFDLGFFFFFLRRFGCCLITLFRKLICKFLIFGTNWHLVTKQIWLLTCNLCFTLRCLSQLFAFSSTSTSPFSFSTKSDFTKYQWGFMGLSMDFCISMSYHLWLCLHFVWFCFLFFFFFVFFFMFVFGLCGFSLDFSI